MNVHSSEHVVNPPRDRRPPASSGEQQRRRRGNIFTGGGTDGNEALTAMTGIVLVALLAVLGITILRIGQLISVHLFVGLLLIGPVALKMASTGYRFMRYYTGDAVYRHKGPPQIILRLIAPGVVVTTVVVFLTGVLLMYAGPLHRDPLLLLHKASFILWLGFTGLHVLGHLPGLGGSLRAGRETNPGVGPSPGSAGRWIALTGAIVAGVILAIVLIPDFGIWTNHQALWHHHDG